MLAIFIGRKSKVLIDNNISTIAKLYESEKKWVFVTRAETTTEKNISQLEETKQKIRKQLGWNLIGKLQNNLTSRTYNCIIFSA